MRQSSEETLEASLAQVESIQARLAEQQQRLQDEIHLLRAELKANQDPGRMHLIQEMISVRRHPNFLLSSAPMLFQGLAWSNVAHKREGYRIGGGCTECNEGYSGP